MARMLLTAPQPGRYHPAHPPTSHGSKADGLSNSPALSHPHKGPGGPGQIPSPGLNHRDAGKSWIPLPRPPLAPAVPGQVREEETSQALKGD